MKPLSTDPHIHRYTTQVVSGIKHCLCLSVANPDNEVIARQELTQFADNIAFPSDSVDSAKHDPLHFQACWVDLLDATKPAYLDTVVPNTVVMQGVGDAAERTYHCADLVPTEEAADLSDAATTVLKEEAAAEADAEEGMALLDLIEEHLRPLPVPAEHDFRTAYPNCATILEQLYDQASCGSCYAFAAVSAAAARACAAGHTIHSKKLSVNDPLACGTRMSGRVCVALSGGRQTTNYANGCDGGQASLVNDYAVDHGNANYFFYFSVQSANN